MDTVKKGTDIIRDVEKDIINNRKAASVEVGDTVRVHYKIVEGNRERIQVYEGVVIAMDNKGINRNITVRRVSYDVGVERIFPLYSPRIDHIDVIRKGRVRRSKLYFLRERTGKSAKLRERKGQRKKKESGVIDIPTTQEMDTVSDKPAEAIDAAEE